MRTLRKYTGFLVKIHSFALIFSFLFPYATPQLSAAFAQESDDGIKVLSAPKDPIAIEGEFLVGFKNKPAYEKLSKDSKPAWFTKLGQGVELNSAFSKFNVAHIRVKNPASNGQWENLANIMSSDPNVAFVEPNYLVHAYGQPNDPMVDDMWFLKNISAFKAWDIPADGKEVVVAVVDSGIQFNHEDLRGRVHINRNETPDNGIDDDKNGFVDDVIGWNFYDGGNMPYSYAYPKPVALRDANGNFVCKTHPTEKRYEVHGSHVTGTIAAMNNNNIGITGIASKIKIMPVKALGGPCGTSVGSSVLQAVIYAANNGARIINMSLGSFSKSKLAELIYRDVTQAGILIVAAAGNESNDNDGPNRSYPASYESDGIISVAATDKNDSLAEFSNYGKTTVDIAAPGVSILSTAPRGQADTPESAYLFLRGTSMATPIVTGAAAALLSKNPNLTNVQIKKILMASVDKVPALQGKVASNGRLNLHKALSYNPAAVAEASPNKADTSLKSVQRGKESIGGIRIFDARGYSQKW